MIFSTAVLQQCLYNRYVVNKSYTRQIRISDLLSNVPIAPFPPPLKKSAWIKIADHYWVMQALLTANHNPPPLELLSISWIYF